MAKLQKLFYLNLSSTKITNEGLREVVKLQKLRSLELTNTKTTAAGAAELQKALPKCRIVHSYKKD